MLVYDRFGSLRRVQIHYTPTLCKNVKLGGGERRRRFYLQSTGD